MNLMMITVLVAAGFVAPGIGYTLSIWPKTSDYINFAVFKSCFGESVALSLEKIGFEVGQKCLQEETSDMQPQNDTNTVDKEITHGNRRKRNLLKMPPNPSVRLQLCNLREQKLLTANNDVAFEVVEKWLEETPIDLTLKTNLQGLAVNCKELQMTQPPPESVGETKKLLKAMSYLRCLNTGGLQACKNYEIQRYAHSLGF